MSASSQTHPPGALTAVAGARPVPPIAELDVPLDRLRSDIEELAVRRRLAHLDSLRERLPLDDPDRHALDTAAEARAHCVAEERRTWSTGENPVFDWIEDEEDGVAELVTVAENGETETVTGYVVTPLEVASEYDDGADE